MIKRIISKLFCCSSNFIKYIRQGGVVYVNIAQVNHNEILKDKKVLITGGSSGIGYAIAKKFVSEGAKVVITGRDIDKLRVAADSMNSNKVFCLEWDVSDVSIVKQKVAQTQELLGGIDIVVNNAGVYVGSDFLNIDEKSWNYVLNTNIKGLFFICQAVSKYYIKTNANKISKIINIASITGLVGDCGPYGISKWGVVGLTKGLARDLTSKNIIVNAIAPGVTPSNINKEINVSDNAFLNSSKNQRVALPEEIAELALFLASDASNNIVGQIIPCDGGTIIQ